MVWPKNSLRVKCKFTKNYELINMNIIRIFISTNSCRDKQNARWFYLSGLIFDLLEFEWTLALLLCYNIPVVIYLITYPFLCSIIWVLNKLSFKFLTIPFYFESTINQACEKNRISRHRSVNQRLAVDRKIWIIDYHRLCETPWSDRVKKIAKLMLCCSVNLKGANRCKQ